MRKSRSVRVVSGVVASLGVSALFVATTARFEAQQASGRFHEISGIVQTAKGPEAGVWVIAETKELQTKFAKIVVTNNDGRFVLPELPNANYNVWVRGYGLVDSAPVQVRPGGRAVTLKVSAAAL